MCSQHGGGSCQCQISVSTATAPTHHGYGAPGKTHKTLPWRTVAKTQGSAWNLLRKLIVSVTTDSSCQQEGMILHWISQRLGRTRIKKKQTKGTITSSDISYITSPKISHHPGWRGVLNVGKSCLQRHRRIAVSWCCCRVPFLQVAEWAKRTAHAQSAKAVRSTQSCWFSSVYCG